MQINDEIKKFQQMRINKQEEEDSEIKDIFENSRKTTKSVTQNKNKYESDDDDDDEEYPTVTSKTSSRAKNSKHSDNDDDDEELPVKPAKGPGLHLKKKMNK